MRGIENERKVRCHKEPMENSRTSCDRVRLHVEIENGGADPSVPAFVAMIFVSHDRMFLRGLGSRVLELGGESGTDRNPTVYPGSYVEYVQKLGHEAPGIYS